MKYAAATEFCNYALLCLRDPFTYTSASANRTQQALFCTRYDAAPDLFLDVFTTIRGAWFHASDILKVQIFICLHGYLTTERGELCPIESATDGEISSAVDRYWHKRITLAVVKKARQLLSEQPTPKGKR